MSTFTGPKTEQGAIASLPSSKRPPNSLLLLFSAYSQLGIRDPGNKMVRLFFYAAVVNEITYVEST